MALHRRKALKRTMAAVSAFFLTVLFSISPCAVPMASAAGSSDISSQAVLSKGTFGTVKKVDKTYYIVDEFGNIVDTVKPTTGIDLDRYIGKQILVKDNLFAGLLESRQEKRNTFYSKLREYLSGIVPGPKVVPPKARPIPEQPPIGIIAPMYGVFPPPVEIIIDPDKKDPGKKIPPEGIVQPMYGVVIVEPGPKEPIVKPPIDVIQPMYGVFPPPVEIIIDPDKKDPGKEIPPYDIIQPMYGVVIIEPDPKEPIVKPPYDIIQPMYGVVIVEPDPKDPIVKPPLPQPLYGVEIVEPIGTIEKPVDGSLAEKLEVIEQKENVQKDMASKGIKVVPDMKIEQKGFQDGSGT